MALTSPLLHEVLQQPTETRAELVEELLRTLPAPPLARSSAQLAAVPRPTAEPGSWQGGQLALDLE
jgi:hypothetical protein